MRRLAAMLAVAAMLAACNPRTGRQEATPSPSATRVGRGPWLHITGKGTATRPVRMVWQVGNRKVYDLLARSYESNGRQGLSVSTFFDVHVTFYGKRGTTLVADSARAIVDEATNTVVLSGHVHAHNGEGMTLSCDTLQYDRTTEMIHGEGHVEMTSPRGMRATGNSVDTDINMTHARLQ